MKIGSILLAIDGSIYSRFAADCAMQLAAVTGASVTAVHVVGLKSAWQAVGFDNPGFLNQAEYVAEFESLSLSLSNLGHRLLQACGMYAQEAGVPYEGLLESNDPYSSVCKLAVDYDLVIIGHRPHLDNRTRSRKSRLSFAESLAHGCPKPLLIVQAPTTGLFPSLMVAASMDHVNSNYLNSIKDLSEQLGIESSVVCVSTGANEESLHAFARDLGQVAPRFLGVPMTVERLSDMTDPDSTENPDGAYPWENWQTPLLVVPTREIGGQRLTLANASPEMFVRYSSLPAVLLYPEDSPHLIANPLAHAVVVNP